MSDKRQMRSRADLLARSPEQEAAVQGSLNRARGIEGTWQDLTQKRLEAQAKGEWSPWLGVQQWAVEIPMNANIRGGPQGRIQGQQAIDEREAAFATEMARLKDLADRREQAQAMMKKASPDDQRKLQQFLSTPVTPKKIGSGVR